MHHDTDWSSTTGDDCRHRFEAPDCPVVALRVDGQVVRFALMNFEGRRDAQSVTVLLERSRFLDDQNHCKQGRRDGMILPARE